MKNKLLKKLRGVREPRALADIQKEYSEVSAKAAQTTYQVWLYKDEAKKAHERMKELNQEAAERNRIDAAAKETLTKAAANE